MRKEEKTSMEKSLKRLLAVVLSLMLMFTMGTTVFAADDVAADVSDEAVVLDEGTAVEGEDVAMDDEESSVEEDVVEAAEGENDALQQVLDSIGELSNDPRDFTAADIDRVEAIQAAYDALSAEDQATVDSTFNHPSGDGQSYGRVLEAAVWAVRSYETDTSTTLAVGTYTAPAVSSVSDKGKSDSSRTRNWWVESVEVSDDGQATAYIYVTSGAATASKLTSYPSVWTGGQTIERNSDNNYPIPVDLNGTTYFGGISSSMPRPIMYTLNTTITEPAAPIELEITNNTGMFKAVSAYLKTESEKEYLVMALSGTGYKELFKGTYKEAVENGDGSEENGNNTWIHGYTNKDGNLEFKIPLNADDSYVPIVAVSNSYYTKYLSGQNSLERAFYPRQFTLDREAKTVVTGDYEYSKALEVTNNISMFKTPEAKIDTVGGPNSNSYKSELILTMQNDSYNKMYVGTCKEASAAEDVIELSSENVFAFPVRWVETFGQPETLKTLVGEPFKASFCSKKNGTWYEREITIDEENGTIVFNDVQADYSAVDAAKALVPEDLSIYTEDTAKAVTDAVAAVKTGKNIAEQEAVDAMAKAIEDAVKALRVDKFEYDGKTVQFIKKDGSEFGMWSVQEGSTFAYNDGQIHISIVPKNTTVYGWLHWGGINEELTKDVELDANGNIVLNVSEENCGWAVPVAPIKKKDGLTTKDQYYLAVPATEYFTTDADYTAVDAAIATVPEDLSIYTEESAAAVTEAVNAVVRDKKAVEQEDVDRMANAIENAVKELKINLSDAVLSDIAPVTYTGKAFEPEVAVTLGETALVLDTDFAVEYADNINAGTAKVTVKGIGNYGGEKTAEFTIKKASQKLTMSTKMKTVKYKKVKKKAQLTSKVAVSGAKTTVTYAKVGGSKKLKINKTTGKITVKKKTKKGTYKIKVKATAASSGNYNSATVTKTIKVKVKK